MKDENDEEFDVEKLSTISFPKPHIVSKPKIWYKKIGNLRSGVGHVYNWGALKESIEKSKNISMEPRKTHIENMDMGGIKVRALEDDTSDFKFQIKNKKKQIKN